MKNTIFILYAGGNLSKGLAFQVKGKLLEKNIETHNYKIEEDILENGFLDKVTTYSTYVARANKIILILSEKYLTQSIFCQDEIREMVSRYRDNYRGNVFIITEDEQIYNNLHDEVGSLKLFEKTEKMIDERIELFNNLQNPPRDRIREIDYCKNTTKELLYDLKEKRAYLYKHIDLDRLVENIKLDIIVEPEEDKDLKNFLSLFNSCFPEDSGEQYTSLLNLKDKNEDINLVNELYKKCISPSSINLIEYVVKKRNVLNAFSPSGIPYTDYITMKLIEDYYILPSAMYKTIDNTGSLVAEYEIEQHEIVEHVYEILGEHRIVFLEGAVGEGKSAFIDKFIYDTYEKYTSEEVNVIYKRLDSENKETEDDIYDEVLAESQKALNNILIIDNLDSFSFDHERFMFTRDGYDIFNTQIEKTRSIVNRLKKLISQNKIKSILLSCRPYVLSHFYNGRRLVSNDPIVNNSRIYSLQYNDDISERIILSRIDLFQEMIDILLNDDSISSGKKSVLKSHSENILTMIKLIRYDTDAYGNLKINKKRILRNGELTLVEEFVPKKYPILEKLLKVSTQGFRTIIRLYQELGYNEKLYNAYFTNSIFLFYTLGLFEKYSQILPYSGVEEGNSNTGKVLNYPNMFLSVAVSEANRHIACAKPHMVTYWLKILLLSYIKYKKKVSVKEIINKFSNYDEGLVKIALGSLGTINEYNCIEYEFPSTNSNNYDDFLKNTKAKLTIRGVTLISDLMYLNYNNLEFFIDDWQLPKPRIDKIFDDNTIDDIDFLKVLYKIHKEEGFNSYKHLVGEHKEEEFSFRKMIRHKSKLIIWYTHFFEIALKKEIKYYKIGFFNISHNSFERKRREIIDRGETIIKSHYKTSIEEEYINSLHSFNNKCKEYNDYIDKYFDKVFEQEIKARCVKC